MTTLVERQCRHFQTSYLKISLSQFVREKWKRKACFERKFWILESNLILPDPELFLVQNWQRMSPSNSTSAMSHKTGVTRHSYIIFIRWPDFTWPWLWHSIRIKFILIWHIDTFFIPFEQGFPTWGKFPRVGNKRVAGGMVDFPDPAIHFTW